MKEEEGINFNLLLQANDIVQDEPQPRRSMQDPVPRQWFEIEGGMGLVFLTAQDGFSRTKDCE